MSKKDIDRNFIKESHKRSKNFKIKHTQTCSNKVLSEEKMNQKINEKSELILTARPFMKQIYDFVKGSNFLSILTDEEGCILTILGDEKILQRAFEGALIPGAYMGEEYIGTNGMGTSLYEGKPLQVSGREHYIETFYQWTCSGAPIRDTDGKIIGCIDLTGDKNAVHSHTLGMVAAAANAIENMLRINKYNEELSRNKKYIETIINSFPAAIFTADFDGNIKAVNQNCKSMLGYTEAELKRIKIWEIIKDWKEIKNIIKVKDSIYQKDIFVNLKVNKLQLNMSAYPVFDNKQQAYEIVFVFKDVKKVRKLANNIIGRKAIYTFDKIIGKDENFVKAVEFAKKIADSKSTVLILGESGTGKEIFAQAIQNYSNRSEEPFIALNCGAIPKNLIESELFGYEEGAFTGAKRGGHPGKFEIADGGTIFLDEIGEMPVDLQTRLLRVIEEGTVSRIGGTEEIPINVRIIAATNRSLKEEVKKGNFRTDLFYRLNVLPIRLPPLRERKQDIPLLVEYFMKRISRRLNKRMVVIPKEYMDYLTNYEWPGNIRELENLIELIINTESIPASISTSDRKNITDAYFDEGENLSLENMEHMHIERILKKYYGNISLTAKILGISRNTLYRKMEKYSIHC